MATAPIGKISQLPVATEVKNTDLIEIVQEGINKQVDVSILVQDLTPADGEPGTNGTDGVDGKDAFEVWKAIPGNELKTIEDWNEFNKGEPGDDAFVVWQKEPGNEEKTRQDFLIAITGKDGEASQSLGVFKAANEAAAIALLPDPTTIGSGVFAVAGWTNPDEVGKTYFMHVVEDAWVNAGVLNEDGEKGDPSINFRFIDKLDSIDELPALIDATEGDLYSIDGTFWGKVSGQWKDMGNFKGEQGYSPYEIATQQGFIGDIDEWLESIRGVDGIGLRILGSLPSVIYLPDQDQVSGDAYIINDKMHVWDTQRWSTVGQVGPEGRNAYKIAVTNGFVGTEQDWIASLKGEPGPRGIEGKNAFQVWQAQSGNAGKTEQDWNKSLEGKNAFETWKTIPGNEDKSITDWNASNKGVKGDPAQAVTILDVLESTDDLPLTGILGSGYSIDGYVWGWTEEDQYKIFGKFQGEQGVAGKSALEIAGEFEPEIDTYDKWKEALRGYDAFVTWQRIPGNEAKTIDEYLLSITGDEGQDAFEIWQAQSGNEGKTLEEFFEQFKGEDLYAFWLKQPGNAGKTPVEFIDFFKGTDGEDGTNGQDAFELWKEIPGNEEKTATEFFAFFKGVNGNDGVDGLSPLDQWLAIPGNEGKTEADYFDSFKGENGANGISFIPDIIVDTVGELPTPPTEGVTLARVADNAYIYRNDAWEDLGLWVSKGDAGEDGTDGADGANAFEVWQAIPGNESKTIDDWNAFNKGVKGEDGDDALEVAIANDPEVTDFATWKASLRGQGAIDYWLSLPENEGKSEQDYFDSFKGANGADGLSPVDEWLALPGNESKTEADYFIFFKGEDGEDGVDGLSPLDQWLAIPGNEGKSEQDYFDSLKGKDAYQSWLEQPGNEGKSESDFTDSLKALDNYELWKTIDGNEDKTIEEFYQSLKGADGTDGEDGVSFAPDIIVATVGELPTPPDEGIVRARVADNAYIYRDGAWADLGLWGLKGDAGEDGEDGVDAFETWKKIPGNESKTIDDWNAFNKGIKGDAGDAGDNALEVAIANDPEVTDFATWKASLRGEDGISPIEQWLSLPENEGKTETDYFIFFKGEDGSDGVDGTDGLSPLDQWLALPGNEGKSEQDYFDSFKGKDAIEAWKAIPGNEAKTDDDFYATFKGEPGDTPSFLGVVETLAEIVEPTSLDVVVFEKHMYIHNGVTWVDSGDMTGERGVQGPRGKDILETVQEVNPAIEDVSDLVELLKGDTGADGEDAMTVIQRIDPSITDEASFKEAIRGEQGIEGPVGPTGQVGNVIGRVDGIEDLPAEGVTGTGWLIGSDYYGWSDDQTKFIFFATIAGPEGPRGEQGIVGPDGRNALQVVMDNDPTVTNYNQWQTKLKGVKGDRGQYWIIEEREPGAIDGVPGDCFLDLNTLMSYRKMSTVLWAPMGKLGGGNVYKPSSDGKRYIMVDGDWVELKLPEAPVGPGTYQLENGDWKQFNRYDLTVQAADTELDLSVCQVFKINASVARTLSFTNVPGADRAITVVFEVSGNANITWPAGILWYDDTPPTLRDDFTIVVVVWTGSRWIGPK